MYSSLLPLPVPDMMNMRLWLKVTENLVGSKFGGRIRDQLEVRSAAVGQKSGQCRRSSAVGRISGQRSDEGRRSAAVGQSSGQRLAQKPGQRSAHRPGQKS